MAVDGVRARAHRDGVVAVDERVVGVGGGVRAARIAVHADIVEQRAVGIAPADFAEGQPVLVGPGADAAEHADIVGRAVRARDHLLGTGRRQVDLRAAPVHLELGVGARDPPHVEGDAVELTVGEAAHHLRDGDVGVGLVAFEIDAVLAVRRRARRAAGLEQFEPRARKQRPAVDRLVVAVAVGIECRARDDLEAAVADEVAVAAIDDVVAARVLDGVGAHPAADHVVAEIAEQGVVAGSAVDGAAGRVAPVQHVVLAAPDQVLDRDQRVSGRIAAGRRKIVRVGGLQAGATKVDDDAIHRTRVARGVVAELAVDHVAARSALQDVGGVVAGDGVAGLAADRVLDHDPVRDREAARDAADPGDVAARIRARQRRSLQVDRRGRRAVGVADRVVAAGIPDAGPEGAGHVRLGQRVGVGPRAGGHVRTVQALHGGDVEGHRATCVAEGVRGRGLPVPAAIVRHDRPDRLILVVVAQITEGVPALDTGEQLGGVVRMVEPDGVSELVNDRRVPHAAHGKVRPGGMIGVVAALRLATIRAVAGADDMVIGKGDAARGVVPGGARGLVFGEVRGARRILREGDVADSRPSRKGVPERLHLSAGPGLPAGHAEAVGDSAAPAIPIDQGRNVRIAVGVRRTGIDRCHVTPPKFFVRHLE